MRRSLFVILVPLFAAGFARGQNTPVSDQTEQVRALLARVELLEKQVAELKANQLATAAPAVALGATPGNPTRSVEPPGRPTVQTHEHERQASQETMQQLEPHYPSLQIRGFADADFSVTDQRGTTSGFNLGQFDLHLASALSRKISYFGEITVNAHPTDYTIEMERSFIRYDYNDYFKISFGRFHTPLGYWNTAYHHGAWLQTTIDRPFMVKVGGTFTPLHFVGAMAEGNIPSGGLGLGYNVGIGNGRGGVLSRPGDAGDINNNRAWVAKLYARPAKAYGLEMGGSFYRDKITLPSGLNYREWIGTGYLVWTKGAPEFLAEFDNVNHRNIATNAVSNSDAAYVQVGYRLPWSEKALKPYYRFEYTHMPLSEQVFTYQPLIESIFGLRYDISNFAAFKSEYRYFSSHAAQGTIPRVPAINGLFFQTAFTF